MDDLRRARAKSSRFHLCAAVCLGCLSSFSSFSCRQGIKKRRLLDLEMGCCFAVSFRASFLADWRRFSANFQRRSQGGGERATGPCPTTPKGGGGEGNISCLRNTTWVLTQNARLSKLAHDNTLSDLPQVQTESLVTQARDGPSPTLVGPCQAWQGLSHPLIPHIGPSRPAQGPLRFKTLEWALS